jgi:(p)ppGpp synthase/HD superfamily hydrolase
MSLVGALHARLELSPLLDPTEHHQKIFGNLRNWLAAKQFWVALDAMEFAASHHTGFRKDKVTPEFFHQVFLANYARSIHPLFLFPEATIACCFTHDLTEDYGEQVSASLVTQRFGDRIGTSTRLLSKRVDGVEIPYEIYFAGMAKDPIASLVKGIDRNHNILTMRGADWSVTKQEKYLQDLEQWFLPMLKAARRNFPQQVEAYENIKMLLTVQAAHIRAELGLLRELEDIPNLEAASPR